MSHSLLVRLRPSTLAWNGPARCYSRDEAAATCVRTRGGINTTGPQRNSHIYHMPVSQALRPGWQLHVSLHHTSCVKPTCLTLSPTFLAAMVHGDSPRTRSFHTGHAVVSNARPKSTEEKASGSVLAQFVGKSEEPKQVTVAAKVTQAGKDVTYLAVILGGFALTGFLFWSVGSEFFSSNSSSTIFTQALKRVKADPRVVQLLGEPITGHGEMSGRGRRRHIPHQEYIVDGDSYMRLKFYVDGSKRKATATIDLKKNDRGKYVCRFLMVELQGAPGGTIIIEDNR